MLLSSSPARLELPVSLGLPRRQGLAPGTVPRARFPGPLCISDQVVVRNSTKARTAITATTNAGTTIRIVIGRIRLPPNRSR